MPTTYELPTGVVASRLGVSRDTVKRWAKAGSLPAICTPGGHWRFNADQVEAFAASLEHGDGAA